LANISLAESVFVLFNLMHGLLEDLNGKNKGIAFIRKELQDLEVKSDAL